MRWHRATLAAPGLLLPLLWPQGRSACTNPLDVTCPLDVTIYQSVGLLCLPLWQLNRAALVLARWVEDLGQWLLDGLFIPGAADLRGPVHALVVVALTLAVLAGAVTVFLQGLLTLRWVDLQRALPTLALAALLLLVGGEPLRVLDSVQQIGAGLLQQTVLAAVTLTTAPALPTAPQDELGDVATSIYAAPITCGSITLAARTPPVVALNDFAARYLWADGADIHCADPLALPGGFRAQYLAQEDISGLDSAARWQAIGRATQGVVRLSTGLSMSGGAITDRGVAQLFRLALGLVFLTLLLALPLGLFVPTDAVLRAQLTAIGTIIRGAWSAALVLGVGLALLLVVAQRGNGWLLWLASLAFTGVGWWQSWQALRALGTALGAANTLAANVPGAAAQAGARWGTTAALLAATAATGGGGALLGVLGRTGAAWLRRAGDTVGDTALARTASAQLARTAQQQLATQQADAQLAAVAQQAQAEAAWYARTYDLATDPVAAQAAQAATARAQQADAQRRSRQLARAPAAGDVATVDRLLRQSPPPAPADPPAATAATAATAASAASPAPPPAPLGLTDAQWALARQAAAAGHAEELARLLLAAQAGLETTGMGTDYAAAQAQVGAFHDLLVQAQAHRVPATMDERTMRDALVPRPGGLQPGRYVTAMRLDGELYLNGVPVLAIDHAPAGQTAQARTKQGPVAMAAITAHMLDTLAEGGVHAFIVPAAPATTQVPPAAPPPHTPASVASAPPAAPAPSTLPWKRGGS